MTGETDLLPGVTGAMGGHSAWLQGLRSPLIKEVFSTPDPGQNKQSYIGRGRRLEGAEAAVRRKRVRPGGDHGEDGGQQAAGARQARGGRGRQVSLPVVVS